MFDTFISHSYFVNYRNQLGDLKKDELPGSEALIQPG